MYYITVWDCTPPCSHEHCLVEELTAEDIEELDDIEIYLTRLGVDYEVEYASD